MYDLDGDGKAEVTFRTADGTVDGTGAVIGDGSKDWRHSTGYIVDGPEYLTVFEGATGKAMDTVPYEPNRGLGPIAWGDSQNSGVYANRIDRFGAAIAYLDGVKPSIVVQRGYYTRMTLAAYNYVNGKLMKQWLFDSDVSGNADYYGEGNHQLSVADVDGDGKDEIFTGAAAIDHDGKGLWSSKLGHGDAMHLSDLDPTRLGYEMWAVQEEYTKANYSAEMKDAQTGRVLWGWPQQGVDVGRGVSADIDPRYIGAEAWAIDPNKSSSTESNLNGVLYTAQGKKLSEQIPSSNFAIWWDGDLSRELLDHTWTSATGSGVHKVDKWDYVNNQLVPLITFTGTLSNNSTKGNPSLQADILGDWREEVILRTEDSSALRIHTTTAPTEHRIYTLMHDPVYRSAIAWQLTGYNQPPHTSFYLGTGMAAPPKPNIYTNTVKATGLSVTSQVYELQVNQQLQLFPLFSPAAVTDASVTWSVYNEDGTATSLATIYTNGLLTAGAAAGKVKVVATANDGSGVWGSTVITLEEPPVVSVPVSDITVTGTNQTASVLTNQTLQFTAAVAPGNATNPSVTWSVYNEDGTATSLATINTNGLLTAGAAAGKVKVVAAANDGSGVSGSTVITLEEPPVVSVPVSDITVTGTNQTASVLTNQSLQFTAAVAPGSATNPSVTWSVYNEDGTATSLATINTNGLLTAGAAAGKVKVVAAANDGSGVTGSTVITIRRISEATPASPVGQGIPQPSVTVTNGKITQTATPDSSGKVVTEILAADLQKAISTGNIPTVVVEVVPSADTKEMQVVLPAKQLLEASVQKAESVEINMGLAAFSIDLDLIKTNAVADSSKIELGVSKVDPGTLPANMKEKLGNSTVFDFTFAVDGKKVAGFGNSLTVAMDYTLREGEDPRKVVIYYIDDNGNLHVVKNSRFDAETGKVEFRPGHFSKYAAAHVSVNFADMNHAAWAKASVDVLAARGIIDGMGDQEFAPNQRVTRAQFIKMLMNSIDAAEDSAQSALSDVKKGSWYYSAVASAQKLGIIQGMADGTFGVNDEITREDMAVMSFRALGHLKLQLNVQGTTADFADQSELSAYSVQAVQLMKQAGIIEGVGEGRFAPKGKATRAQAAVMIHKLFQLNN